MKLVDILLGRFHGKSIRQKCPFYSIIRPLFVSSHATPAVGEPLIAPSARLYHDTVLLSRLETIAVSSATKKVVDRDLYPL